MNVAHLREVCGVYTLELRPITTATIKTKDETCTRPLLFTRSSTIDQVMLKFLVHCWCTLSCSNWLDGQLTISRQKSQLPGHLLVNHYHGQKGGHVGALYEPIRPSPLGRNASGAVPRGPRHSTTLRRQGRHRLHVHDSPWSRLASRSSRLGKLRCARLTRPCASPYGRHAS